VEARWVEGGYRGPLGKGGIVPPKERDVDHWLNLAEQAQVQAEQMTNAETKREMMKIAAAYGRLAEHAERTTGRKAPRK
jgi:hypothetical protein